MGTETAMNDQLEQVPKLPPELAEVVKDAEKEYQRLLEKRQEALGQLQALQVFIGKCDREIIAACGFLGKLYQTYPNMKRLPGILVDE